MRFLKLSLLVGFAASCLAYTNTATAESPTRPVASFSKAKVLARDTVYRDHKVTLYCGCIFKSSGRSGGKIGSNVCGYQPRKNATRGARLEWEHIMPASLFGRPLQCWKVGHPNCVNSKGKPFKGRKCCGKVNERFEKMEADLHNLVPSVGELNGDRSNLPFGIVAGEKRSYGACDFEIDKTARIVEPAKKIRGDVARVWLYMNKIYGVSLSSNTKAMMNSWSNDDPPDAWEIERDKRIEAIQGNRNPFVTK